MSVQELDHKVLDAFKKLINSNEKISIRKISRMLWMEKSLRSVQLSVERLKRKWKLYVDELWKIRIIEDLHLQNIKTKRIPLIWVISCWGPILADEYIEDYIPISKQLIKDGSEYYLLRTKWDSMNEKWINPWDVILIEKTNTCSNNDIIVALINDSVSLKEFQTGNWFIKLIPHSTNPENKITIVTEDLIIQWIFRINLWKI